MASATGWSVDHILNDINYQTLILMLADAPRYVRKRAGDTGGKDTVEEAAGIVGFFQSKL